MGKRGFAPMSPISVAISLVSWIDTHGRRPNSRDCCSAKELPHHQTFYRLFGSAGSFGLMIAEAERIGRYLNTTLALSNGVQKNAVCVLSTTMTTASSVKIRTCLGRNGRGRDCGVRFPDEGPHIRLCRTCRTRLFGEKRHNDVSPVEPMVSRVQLQRWNMTTDNQIQDTINWNGEKEKKDA